MTQSLFGIIVFPGFIFLCVAGVFAEYFDRIFHARMQNRKGPPWFQPIADFIKLSAKEDIVPEEADHFMFKAMPVVAVSSAVTAVLYIPLWTGQAMYSFEGDLVIVLYLLTIPTMTFFLAGWYSTSMFAAVGAVRTLTQLFSYEVPLYIALLAPAVLANTWSLSGMTAYYANHPGYWLFNLPALAVTMVILLGKLEKVPFDINEAETEIVGGIFTEYGGRFLAFFRMAIDIETIVVASLVAAVFLPFGLGLPPVIGFVLYLAKVALVVAGVSFLRTIFARLRIDQMVSFCWKYLAPAAMVQMLINLILKGVLPQ
jgi:NADH-quinone oxidoreductase subunit H